jgi:diaminohydroxyphosphoribosylaminopyrimidine deaminase/5-amino-6-(5-phosphoribosylamino)uracil reductase
MEHDARWMRRCLAIARLGASEAAPNPMVGAVLAQGGRLLAEGWHQRVGGPHAEVECLRAFGDGPVPADASLYIALEPCSHHGRTPPCTDLILARGVRRVVAAMPDPFPEVAGRGIQQLRSAGIEVVVGVEEAEARWTNRRFLTSVVHGRPYIVLKWARSADGFLDDHGRTVRISSPATDVLVHRWRSEEQAILVGSRTVVNDDPALTVRHVAGRQPLRVAIDRGGRIPHTARILTGPAPALLYTSCERPGLPAGQVPLGHGDVLEQVLADLHRREMRSVLVEGGAELLRHFLARGLWDEARIITGQVRLGGGTPAPPAPGEPVRTITLGNDTIAFHVHAASPAHVGKPSPAWPW